MKNIWLLLYCLAVFVATPIGVYFVSGIFFYDAVNGVFLYYIPAVFFILCVVGWIVAYIRAKDDKEAQKKLLLPLGSFNRYPNLWPIYMSAVFLFVAVGGGPLISFMLWANARLISKVVSYEQLTQVVELRYVGVNNYRRRNMLRLEFQMQGTQEVIAGDIWRGAMRYKHLSDIRDTVDRVDEMVCIKGFKAPWGLVVNLVTDSSECQQ